MNKEWDYSDMYQNSPVFGPDLKKSLIDEQDSNVVKGREVEV